MTIKIHGRGVATFEIKSLVDGRIKVTTKLRGKTTSGTWAGPKMKALQAALRHWEKRYAG